MLTDPPPDQERLETVILALCSSHRTEQPSAEEAHLWIKELDTETGQIRWARRDLLEEYWRLQAKIRGFLEAVPSNPPLIQKHQPEAAKAHLAAGRAIYYGDPRYPGQIVKEYPDGRRQLVEIDEKSVVTVIKEI